MKKTLLALLAGATLAIALPAFAAEPSLHEVYQAADAGRMDDAQRMMHEVLQAHPNSGKAHYVEAELLARQGKKDLAANELATAEKLAPGLPFASTQSVTHLRASLGHTPTASLGGLPAPAQTATVNAESAPSHFPWSLLLLGVGLIAFIAWVMRFMSQRNASQGAAPSAGPFGDYRPAYPQGPSQGGSMAMPEASAPAGQGLGSRMLGGLATGAAVGAGVVAGEALMHRLMDGNSGNGGNEQRFSGYQDIPDLPSTPVNDLGGNDFGISDASSWDDGSSDSDWT